MRIAQVARDSGLPATVSRAGLAHGLGAAGRFQHGVGDGGVRVGVTAGDGRGEDSMMGEAVSIPH